MTEEETRSEEKIKQKSFWNIIFLPFKIIGAVFSFVSKTIKTGIRVISLIFLIFILWFGYSFYTVFSDFTEKGIDKQDAAIEAFNITLNKATNTFEKISSSVSFRNPFSDRYSGEKNIRDLFIDNKGIPEAYLLMISYDEIKKGIPIKREEPLRFEVWFYSNPYNKKVIFENGFFKEEKKVSATDDFIENNLSPLVFSDKTTKNEVQTIFGKASCVIIDKAGEDVLTTYRFKETDNTPLAAVTFVNEKLIFVTVGIVFLSDNEQELCK